MTPPSVSVVVPTRNRPDQIGPCVESLLANPATDFELLVVDQSDSGSTEAVLASYEPDTRVHYIKTATRGASNARNAGIASARGHLIAFTDDDCRVPADWAARILRLFEETPDTGVVFGRVVLPEAYAARGFGAEFEPREREFQFRLPTPDTPWGISANMAVRREVVARIGGFDALLGPGAVFPAAEDTDFTIRALAAGLKVINAREVSVLHLGVREGAEAGRLARGYGIALGAAFAKHLRLGTKYGGVRLLPSWFVKSATRSLRNLVTGTRPSGFGFTVALVVGAWRSVAYGIDRTKGVFVPRGPSA